MIEISPSQFKAQTEPTRSVASLDYTRRLAFKLVLVHTATRKQRVCTSACTIHTATRKQPRYCFGEAKDPDSLVFLLCGNGQIWRPAC